MEKQLLPFVIFLITFMAINIIGYLVAFKNTKEKVYKHLAIYWGLVLLIVFSEGSIKEGNLALSLVFLSNFPPIFILSRFLLGPYNYGLKTKYYLIALPIVIALAILLDHLKMSGPLICSPVTLICLIPFVEVIAALFITRKKEAELDEKIFGAIISLMGIGCVINYGLNRFDPTPIKNIVGFGTALIAYITYSIFLPMFCIGRLKKEKMYWLEREVSNRTQELLKSKQEKEKLLSVLIHDVSNPLMSATHNLKAALKDQEFKYIQHSIKGLESIKNILQHVREYESVLRERGHIKLKTINLSECLEEIEDIFKHQLEEKNIRLNIQIHSPFNLAIRVDKTAFIHSVLSNIVSNAIKFSLHGSEIKIISFHENFNTVIKVIDNGIGMPPEMTEKLFDLGPSISRKGTAGEPGCGFGLPIVKAYISLFGGSVDVLTSQETENCGTIFTIILPTPDFHEEFKSSRP